MGDLPDDLLDDAAVLDLAASYAQRWLDSVPDRRIPATGTATTPRPAWAPRFPPAVPARSR
jgi:hypothetical protein